MKISDKIKEHERTSGGVPCFSLEYFPPKTEAGVQNLYDRLDRMSELNPLFIDVTWGAGGSTADLTMEICQTAQNVIGLETNMHLTCTNVTKEKVETALSDAKKYGIQNIVALRGDPPHGQEKWEAVDHGFCHASDLVEFIRKEHGDYFGISVAGYPEGHVDGESYEKDLEWLVYKVEQGADIIITQLFYDVDLFLKFVQDCRARGITCPILPGIMPIQSYNGFKRMTQFCKTKVPAEIDAVLEPIKDNDEAVKNYGIDLAVQMCRKILDADIMFLHFYTLNLERSVVAILKQLGLILPSAERPLPWKQSAHSLRNTKEDVRPIFWSNRPKSYLVRTLTWDDFPNGRWGDSRSAAWGDISDHYLSQFYRIEQDKGKTMWGEHITGTDDVIRAFVRYVNGEIDALPWCETPLSLESDRIRGRLLDINKKGMLTINSQPAVNGESSDDPAVGWGGSGGYVYQKAYIEFFASADTVARLLAILEKFPTVTYQAVNKDGDFKSNAPRTNAVTWGVFPGKEIVQPTVVSGEAFMVWKDEAFDLWRKKWADLYEDDEDKKVIEKIADEWYLVNIVENNFISGDIFKVLEEL